MAKGWFRRKKGKLVYCWHNANGDERSKVVGVASMSDADGWLRVGELGPDKLVNKPDPTKATFGDVAAHYLAAGKKRNGEDKAESTKGLDRHIYEDYLKVQWADRLAKEIEPLEVQEWLDGLKKTLADATRDKIRNVMAAIYRQAQKWGIIPRSEECSLFCLPDLPQQLMPQILAPKLFDDR